MFDNIKNMEVFLYDKPIGELVILPNKTIAFEYSNEFMNNGFAISPFYLPLEKKVYIGEKMPFNGLYGVFHDSLPDGFGNLLVDRFLKSKGINTQAINMLQRLSLLGSNSMGALSYKPNYNDSNIYIDKLSFDEISKECKGILENKSIADVESIFKQGGSNGGARPKISYKEDNIEYIIKFHTKEDGSDNGAIEYIYSLMAKSAGLEMPYTGLVSSKSCPGYFKVKRFDRDDNRKIHMHSLAGLCNLDFRIPALDYKDIMTITLELTKDMEEVKKVFKLAIFNICVHNKDDHSKNFAYLYKNNRWYFSPVFDLTYSEGFNAEHNTLFMGKGSNITHKDFFALGYEFSLSNEFIRETIEKIKYSTSRWESLAKQYDVKPFNIKKIKNQLLLI